MSTPTGPGGSHAAGDSGAGTGGDRSPSSGRPAQQAQADHRLSVQHGQPMDRQSVLEREKNAFGGMKFGSAFFGWLTATGTGVLLTALLAAAGAAVGLATGTAVGEAVGQATSNAAGVGIAGAVGLLVVLLIAYFCGGYVAGRMARFNGAKQGVAVWIWAVVIAVVLAVLGAVAGSQYNVLSQLNTLPRLPIGEGQLSTGGIITAVAAAAVSLLGAILGGLAGMRFHRKVDKAGLGR